MHQESEIKSSKKRKNDENCGPSSVATENVSKAFRSKQGRSLLGSNSSNCQVKWDMPKEKAEKLYQELGVSELPPISPSKCVDVGPETPKSMRNMKKRESGYYSRGSITPVFSNIMTTGLTPPFSSLDLNILRQNRTPRSSNSLNSLEKPVEVPHFEKLSDEMTLKIFGFLSKKVLAWRCSLVNRKWNKLASDLSLWKSLDLKSKKLSAEQVRSALERGLVAVRFQSATITGSLKFSSITFIQYLDFTAANIEVANLNAILANNSVSLKKLSVENLIVNQETLDLISGKHIELEVLHMAMCTTEEGEMFKEPLSGSMKELNIGWMVNFIAANIVDKLPSGLQRLNISGNLEDNFTDSTVAKIVLRCPKLIELDISDCMKLTDKSLYAITRRLKALKTLSISRNYMMADFSTIKMIPSLESLNIYGLDEDTLVLPSYSNLAVNESAMSTVARPSAHGFRNSIWGVRLK